MDKATLRRHMLAKRAAIPRAERIALHAAIAEFLLQALPPDTAMLGAYMPVRGEADILAPLATLNLPLCLPCTVPERRLIFRRWQPGEAMGEGAFGIAEPLSDAPEAMPDTLLVPLVAFDRACHRLGYGGGYYDRTIAALRQNGLKAAIGIAYACQEAPLLPAKNHDMRLDAIITENAVIWPER